MPQGINTNIASLTAQRNLNTSQNSLNTSLQRLSSGLRINSAKDDAAGLAITERFTSQIRGLNQAQRNANDGISLAQTAEGDLAAITNNLQRIRELAVQSANATNSESDRAALQLETSELIAEIDRVASTSAFNGVKLLDGNFSSQQFQVGANSGETVSISSVSSARTSALGQTNGATFTNTTAVTSTYADGDLVVNGQAITGTTADAKSIADAITALDPTLTAQAENAQTGIAFTTATGTDLAVGTATPATFEFTNTFASASDTLDFSVDSARFTVDGNQVDLDGDYSGTGQAGVAAKIQADLGGSYSVTVNANTKIEIATTATGSAETAPAVVFVNGNLDGGSVDSIVADFFTGTEVVGNNTQNTLTATLGGVTDGSSTGDFTLTIDGQPAVSITLGNSEGVVADHAAELDSDLNTFLQSNAEYSIVSGSLSGGDLKLEKDDGTAISFVAAGTTTSGTGVTGASITESQTQPATATVLTAANDLIVKDFSENSVIFTVTDEIGNSTEITLDQNFASVDAVKDYINNQLQNDVNGASGLTATLDGGTSGALEFTRNDTLGNAAGDSAILSSYTNSNLDGGVGDHSDFTAGTSAAGLDGSTYTLSIDGVELDFTAAAAAGDDITAAEVAALIHGLEGYTASENLGTLTIEKDDGSNFVLSESGPTSAAQGLAANGAVTPTSDTYRGVVTSIVDTDGVVKIENGASGTSSEAGLSAGETAVDTTALVGTSIEDTDISDVLGANAAILSVDAALSNINTSRASLGAIQNRFESVVSSIQTTSENLSAARSRIRDTDFAEETAALTRAQILQQAGVSILSQANSLPQNVLALLQ